MQRQQEQAERDKVKAEHENQQIRSRYTKIVGAEQFLKDFPIHS